MAGQQLLDWETMMALKDILIKDGMTEFHINHKNCPAGNDTRQRLYASKSDDSRMLLAFCHNCQSKGAVKLGSYIASSASSSSEIKPKVSNYDTLLKRKKEIWIAAYQMYYSAVPVPATDEDPVKGFPPLVQSYLINLYTKEELLAKKSNYSFYDIRVLKEGISKDGGKIIIPRFSDTGLVGVDIRTMKCFEEQRKWSKYQDINEDGTSKAGQISIFNTEGSRTAVICEDLFSAIRIDLSGYAGISLGGLNDKSQDIYKLSLLYDTIFVWLDNDSGLVEEKAGKLAAKLRMFGAKSGVVKAPGIGHNSKQDPKYYTSDQVKRILSETRTH